MPRTSFSGKQWKLKDGRRCTDCDWGLFEDDAAIAGLAKACATSLRENFQRVAAPVPAPLTLHVQKLESLLEPAPTPA